MIRSIKNLLVVLILGGAAFTAAYWSIENVRWEEPACPPGTGHGLWEMRWIEDRETLPAVTDTEKLLSRHNFGATSEAAGDLRDGVVDKRLVSTLLTISKKHSICVRTFKAGHRFLPEVEDGPTIPEGFGEAGGLPNTQYFGRAADIYWVDGVPVEGNGTKPAVLDVGRVLAGIPPDKRPDQIIGPGGWAKHLSYGWAKGWVLSKDQLELHEDHLHLGYRKEKGTHNRR